MEDTILDTPTPQEFALPESFSDNAAFEGIDSLESLASKYAETHQAHSDMIAGQPQLPEGPDGYEIKPPEGQELDEGLITAFKGWMHEAGVTNEGAQKISDEFNSFMGELINAQQVEKDNQEKAAVESLKKEWGSEFAGKAEISNKGLNRFFAEAGIDKDEQDKFTSQFGNNPTAVKLFHAIGSKIAESPAFDSDGFEPQKTGPGRTEGGSPMLHDYSKTMTK